MKKEHMTTSYRNQHKPKPKWVTIRADEAKLVELQEACMAAAKRLVDCGWLDKMPPPMNRTDVIDTALRLSLEQAKPGMALYHENTLLGWFVKFGADIWDKVADMTEDEAYGFIRKRMLADTDAIRGYSGPDHAQAPRPEVVN